MMFISTGEDAGMAGDMNNNDTIRIDSVETAVISDTVFNNAITDIIIQADSLYDAVNLIIVSVDHQMMYCVDSGKVSETFPVSTSKYGVGCTEGSNMTPTGFHMIADKVGEGEPIGMQFRWKEPTGEVLEIYTDSTDVEKDWMTTRLMHLKGLEQGLNLGDGVDSYSRHIYIHGTQEEGLIGTPASHGCIRMKNEDVIKLYSQVEEGDIVYILKLEEE